MQQVDDKKAIERRKFLIRAEKLIAVLLFLCIAWGYFYYLEANEKPTADEISAFIGDNDCHLQKIEELTAKRFVLKKWAFKGISKRCEQEKDKEQYLIVQYQAIEKILMGR